jgi:hypothetical protein
MVEVRRPPRWAVDHVPFIAPACSYIQSANNSKNFGKVRRKPQATSTPDAVAVVFSGGLRRQSRAVSSPQKKKKKKKKKVMMETMTFPDSGPTLVSKVSVSAIPAFASARVVRSPRQSDAIPAARMIATTGATA